MKKKKAFGLLRVSTVLQEMVSQENQLKKIADDFGYEITNFFSEKITGYDEYDVDRDSIKELLANIKKAKPQAVFILELSRLTRRSIKVSKYINDLSLKTGTPFYFNDHKIWTIENGINNENGINTLYNCAKAVEDELKRIKERTMRGRDEKARQGFYVGHLKDGYKVCINDEGNKIIEIDEERADVIKKIFDLYAENMSISEIMNWLNGKNIPTTNKYRTEHTTLFKGYKKVYNLKKNKNRETLQKREDALWVGSCIANILRDRWYIGERQYKNTTYPVPRIITDEKWEIVQSKLDNNKTNVGKPAKNQYLLNNILYCGICGRKLYAHTDEYNNMYYCSSQEFGKEERCGLRWIRQQNLDAIIYEIISYRTINNYKEDIFLKFWEVDKTKIKNIKELIITNKQLIKIKEDYKVELEEKLSKLINEKVQEDNPIIKNSIERLITSNADNITKLDLEIIELKNSIKSKEKELKSLESFARNFQNIRETRDFYTIKKTVNNIINKIELYNPNRSITLIKIYYKHGKTDLALYSPRSLKKKFLFLSYMYSDLHSKYDCKNQHFTFNGKYLSIKAHDESIFDEEFDYNELDYNSEGISIPHFHSEKNKRKYMELASLRHKNKITDKTQFELETSIYDELLRDGIISNSFEEYLSKLKENGYLIFKDYISVIDYFNIKKTNNTLLFEYEDLYPMSEKGIQRKEYNKEYHRIHREKKAAQIKYLVKDLNYQEILKERKKLYNKKYKVKQYKMITEEERLKKLAEIDTQLSILKYKVKYLPKEEI